MHIGIIGCGNMGSAIVSALIRHSFCSAKEIMALEKDPEKTKDLSIQIAENMSALINFVESPGDVMIIAVKPQSFSELAKDLRGTIPKETLVLSIMAGVSLKQMREGLSHHNLARAMPNTPALVREGFTAWAPGDIKKADEKTVAALLGCIGKHLKVKNEEMINAATAISGSGPAYLFTLTEAWIEKATELGFSAKEAKEMVLQTIKGAYKLIENNPDTSPAQLREQVTSKGGTTAAALDYLRKQKWSETFRDAIHKAYERAEEIGNAK